MTINNLVVPCYPEFAPLDIGLKNCLHPRLSLTHDGVSEFTYSALYLFRSRYNYRISRNGKDGGFIISGEQKIPAGFPAAGLTPAGFPAGERKTFFMTPCDVPDPQTLESLFATHDFWKNISETVLTSVREKFSENAPVIMEDRNNFDYLYNRSDLAQLAGKKYHKKKNHVNNFLSSYPDYEQRPMNKELIPAALEILERWQQNAVMRNENEGGSSPNDYPAAKEALELFDHLTLKGSVFFVGGKPAAYCMGESIARGRMYAIHFEKANDEYRGIYQFMNQAYAASLPNFFTLINREQDLGSEGLRQAKMTYRPCGFVKKYIGIKAGS